MFYLVHFNTNAYRAQNTLSSEVWSERILGHHKLQLTYDINNRDAVKSFICLFHALFEFYSMCFSCIYSIQEPNVGSLFG